MSTAIQDLFDSIDLDTLDLSQGGEMAPSFQVPAPSTKRAAADARRYAAHEPPTFLDRSSVLGRFLTQNPRERARLEAALGGRLVARETSGDVLVIERDRASTAPGDIDEGSIAQRLEQAIQNHEATVGRALSAQKLERERSRSPDTGTMNLEQIVEKRRQMFAVLRHRIGEHEEAAEGVRS